MQPEAVNHISGTAVKLAYKTVNTFRPGHIRYTVKSLLPRVVDETSRQRSRTSGVWC